MVIHQTATVKWLGSLKLGKGEITTQSGALAKVPFTFGTRFEGQKSGTNPEELIASAHAACFSLALTDELQKMLFIADSIKVQAQVALENTPKDGWKITNIHLDVEAVVLGCLPEVFEAAANKAKLNCPVSQLLRAPITMNAKLTTLPGEMFEHGPS